MGRDDHNAILGFKDEYRFLSNFWMHHLEMDGEIYNCVEQYYCASKCKYPEDRASILNSTKPGDIKRLGRGVALVDNWDTIKTKVMLNAVLEKFRQNQDLWGRLYMTSGRYLEETNHWNDTFWGVCNGNGKNMLGRILMWVRDVKMKRFGDVPF